MQKADYYQRFLVAFHTHAYKNHIIFFRINDSFRNIIYRHMLAEFVKNRLEKSAAWGFNIFFILFQDLQNFQINFLTKQDCF